MRVPGGGSLWRGRPPYRALSKSSSSGTEVYQYMANSNPLHEISAVSLPLPRFLLLYPPR